MEKAITLIWFRNAMRLHDQPLITGSGTEIGAFCFDQRWETPHPQLGFTAAGPHRLRFLKNSLAELGGRKQIKVVRGHPPTEICRMAEELGAAKIIANREPGTFEQRDTEEVRAWCGQKGIEFKLAECGSLFEEADLPFSLSRMPDFFTAFRKLVEPLAPPPLQGQVPAKQPTSSTFLQGGEAEGLARLNFYLFESQAIRTYKATRNAMTVGTGSSLLSPYLAVGCLSPRYVLAEIFRHEAEFGENESTYWLKFELLWREFFRWQAYKHKQKLFQAGGISGLQIEWSHHQPTFQRWIDGTTGFPIVDANMRQLAQMGFMSNRGRQIVASFLTKNLGIDWRWGAAWFEHHLTDYDVASNYGNWQYAAGVGADAREFRVFNPYKQADQYDAGASHAKQWLKELEAVPSHQVHRMDAATRHKVGYPAEMVSFERSASENRARYERARHG